jgi:hypothetical protein
MLTRDRVNAPPGSSLHLGVSMRSFRAEKLSEFVAALIEFDAVRAQEIQLSLAKYPIFLTRDLKLRAAGCVKYDVRQNEPGCSLRPTQFDSNLKEFSFAPRSNQ